jgi:glyoxylase-like metal-dependent hydrolase (beta-lactamase superfamily II)
MSPRRLGDFALSSVVETERALFDTAMVFPHATDDALKAQYDWMLPLHFVPDTRSLVLIIQSFLIRTGRATILVDTCIGNHKPRARAHNNMQQFPWMARLHAAGVKPEEIDYVMCTHLHVDHVGWNTRLVNGRWVPTFPNAKYIFAKREYEHWEKEARSTGLPRTGNYMADSVLPVVEAGRAVFVEMDHEIDRGVTLYPLPGHTPGQCGLHVKSNGSEALLTGDMMHHPLQVVYPDWSTGFDTDQAHAARTRRAFLEKYADSGTLIVPAHFVAPTAGTIESRKDTFRFRFKAAD